MSPLDAAPAPTPASTDPATLDARDIAALQEGDDRALNRLMLRWEAPLRAFVFRYTQHEQDALDLAQETFVRVYLHRGRFRPGARFSTWMFQIALNLARDRARRVARRPTSTLDAIPEPIDDLAPPDRAATQAERVAALRAALAELPADQRAVVTLCEYQQLPQAEIATILGTTAKGVETRLYRAKQVLRKKLGRWLES